MTTEAIVVKNATKKYGSNKPILDGLNLTVTKGSIYGLLGASGCGKTTLLSCIVGIRSLDSGEIWVFGGAPSSKTSSIPGPRVGYMPQEISLVHELTVINALNYFGQINGLDTNLIHERYNFLSELLQLPPKNHFIKNMSGGQQRRVSFACALLHQPELLILDEPTVGLDPILSANIWNFLATIAKNGVTIIITTHYIDEAKLANKIGLLRDGKLLAQISPKRLLTKCHCDSLETAFMLLCQKQENGEIRPELQQLNFDNDNEHSSELENISDSTTSSTLPITDHNCNVSNINKYNTSISWMSTITHDSITLRRYRRFQALMMKNLLQFIHHPGGILFAFLIPFIQVNIFFNAIGGDPRDLKIAVVNHEAGDCHTGTYIGEVIYSSDNFMCSFKNLSCRFLNSFHHNIAKNKFYNDMKDARDSVKRGETAGLMYFGKNFSRSLQERLENFYVEDIASGQIHISLDSASREISLYLERTLYDRFFDTYSRVLQECALPTKLADLPLRLEEPIFGKNATQTTYMVAAFILTLIFFMATSVSSSIIITDRCEGVWYRSLVQGVTTGEIFISHLLTQVIIVIIQVFVISILTFFVYHVEYRGSLVVIIALIFSTGFCGMCYGFLISILCTSHTVANFIATGSFYPVILLCGCIWPSEGIPLLLRWFSFTLPTTIPAVTLRNIIFKGYHFNNLQIYQGFIIIAMWIICLITLCFIAIRRNKL